MLHVQFKVYKVQIRTQQLTKNPNHNFLASEIFERFCKHIQTLFTCQRNVIWIVERYTSCYSLELKISGHGVKFTVEQVPYYDTFRK